MDHVHNDSCIMDHVHNDSELRRSGSFSRISSTKSSFRRQSFNLSGADDDDDSVSEAGDIGDRALHSNRYSGSGRPRLSFDSIGENPVFPIEEHYANESQLPTAIVDEKDQNEVGFRGVLCFSHLCFT